LFIAGVGYGVPVLFIPDVTDTLEKEKWEDVGLEISGVNRSPKDVGRLPEMAFELAERYPLLIQVGTLKDLIDPSILTPRTRGLAGATVRLSRSGSLAATDLLVGRPCPPESPDFGMVKTVVFYTAESGFCGADRGQVFGRASAASEGSNR
jgi:hypothetical protein